MDETEIKMAIKALMNSDMSARAYAQHEAWDIQSASNILSMVESLMNSEIDEPEDMARLEAIENGLIDFILAEQKERAEALGRGGGNGEEEGEEENKSIQADLIEKLFSRRSEVKALKSASAADERAFVDTMIGMFVDLKAFSKRKDVSEADKKRAKEKYGDVEFADEKNEKYALGSEKEIRAAWNYIGMPKNQKKYSPEEVRVIKKRIVAAWKKKIDKEGPPGAEEKKGRKAVDSEPNNAETLQAREEKPESAGHSHEHSHMGKDGLVHTHSHEHDHGDGPTDMHEHSHAMEHSHDHSHMDGTAHSHQHVHDGVIDHESMMAHAHSHIDWSFGGEEEPEVTQPKSWDEMLVTFGDAVKAAPEGIIEGYLVRFSTAEDPDATGDFFTKNTDFGDAKQSYSWYHHKLPLKSKAGAVLPAYTKQLGSGKASLTKDDVGVFVKLTLDMRDEYEKAIYEMAAAGRLGWSSGTLPNLVERKTVGDATWIKTWPLGLDASVTPKPAEFRNVVSIKSLTPEAALPDMGVEKDFYKEIENMDKVQFDAAVKSAVDFALAAQAAKDAEVKKAEEDKQNAIREGYKMAVKDLQAGKPPAFNVIEVSKDPEMRNGGVDGFRHWVKTGQENGELIPADTRGFKAAFNVNAGASGAFLVPDILYGIIQPKRDLISWVRQAPVQHLQTPADHLLVPVEDTKTTPFVQTNEQGTYNENEGTVAQKDIYIYKYTKEVQMTEEFINYNQTNFDAWLASSLARAEARTENTQFTLGPGGSAIEGVVSGATSGNTIATTAVIAPSDLTALIGYLGAGYNVQGEVGFLMTNKTRWYIKGVQTTGFFAFINTPAPAGPNESGYNAGNIGDPGILGVPVWISDDLTAYTDTTGTLAKTPVVFGNWFFYAVVERPGMMLQRNPYLHMNQGIVSLFASIYRGGGVLQQEAFYGLITK